METVTPDHKKITALIRAKYQFQLEHHETSSGKGSSWTQVKSQFVASGKPRFTLPWLNRVLRGTRVKKDMLMHVAELLYVHVDEISLPDGEAPDGFHYEAAQRLRGLFMDDRRSVAEVSAPPGYGARPFVAAFTVAEAGRSSLYFSIVADGQEGLVVRGDDADVDAKDLAATVRGFFAKARRVVVFNIEDCACRVLSKVGAEGVAARKQLAAFRSACQAAGRKARGFSERLSIFVVPVSSVYIAQDTGFEGAERIVLGGLDQLSAYRLFFSKAGEGLGELEKSATLRRHFEAVGYCPVLIKAFAGMGVLEDRLFSMRQFDPSALREQFEVEAEAFELFWSCLPVPCRAVLVVACFFEGRLPVRLLASLSKSLLLDEAARESLMVDGQANVLEAVGLIETIRLLQQRGFLVEDEFGLAPVPWLRFFFCFSDRVAADLPEMVGACVLRGAGTVLANKPELRARCLAGLGRWEEAAASFQQYLGKRGGDETPHDDLLELFGLFLDPGQNYRAFSEPCAHLPEALLGEFVEAFHRILFARSGHGDPMLLTSEVVLAGSPWRRLNVLGFDMAVFFLNKVWGWRIYTAANEEALKCARKIAKPKAGETQVKSALRQIPLGLSHFWMGRLRDSFNALNETAAFSFDEMRNIPSLRRDIYDAPSTVQTYLGLIWWQFGDPERSVEYSRNAVRLAEEVGKPTAVSYSLYHALAKEACWMIRGQRSRSEFDQYLIQLADSAGGHRLKIWMLAHQLYGAWSNKAPLRFKELMAEWQHSAALSTSLWQHLLADIYVQIGDAASALLLIDSTLSWCGRTSERWVEGSLHLQKIRILRGQVDDKMKESRLHDAIRSARRSLGEIQLEGDAKEIEDMWRVRVTQPANLL